MKPLDPARFELAVTALALYRAKTAVIAQIRADGLKLGQFSSREINGSAKLISRHTWRS